MVIVTPKIWIPTSNPNTQTQNSQPRRDRKGKQNRSQKNKTEGTRWKQLNEHRKQKNEFIT
jgi:hypothetical protein